MRAQTKVARRSFPVHAVERATKPLSTYKTQESVQALLGSQIEACCDYTSDCVQPVLGHPLLTATHLAFSQHRPLVLSPDMIWVTIVQGLAQHVKNHAEKLRQQFVSHQGKLEITVSRRDFLKGSPENAWAEAIGQFSQAIRQHLGPTHANLIADFTTTGPVERTACEVALLDAFQPYFEYRMLCICGIPEITLEGTTEDWQRLRAKVDSLRPYDLDWWLPSVRRICDHFVRASEGDVVRSHWQDIYKRHDAYGGDTVNGWIVQLIPYLKHPHTGSFTVRNPLLEKPKQQVSPRFLPTGISQVPFRCQWPTEEVAMEFLGGFVGVTQEATTLALRPKLGWAVRRAVGFDQLLARIARFNPVPPLEGPKFDECIERIGPGWCELPGDFLRFYKSCNGVRLFGSEEGPVHFLPLERMGRVENLKTQRPADYPSYLASWDVRPWVRFCNLPGGTFVVLEFSHTHRKGWKIVRGGTTEAARTGTNPIIAWSFQEFLEQALAREGRLDFPDVGCRRNPAEE